MKFRIIGSKLLALASMLIAGCESYESGYIAFYTPAMGATPEAIAACRETPPPVTPILERFPPADMETIQAGYAKRGYIMIGHSMFSSGTDASETSALKQGQSIGADLVLVLDPQYTGSTSASVPIETPTTSSTYTSDSASAYGFGGLATANGNTTSTTYGSKTTYIPTTVHRYNYGAVYFIKSRFDFGAFTRDLNDVERQELETNHGAVVMTIVDETPAFNADIIPGDIITAVDDTAVANSDALLRMMRERSGEQVSVTLLRFDKQLEKVVQLNK